MALKNERSNHIVKIKMLKKNIVELGLGYVSNTSIM